MSTYTITVPADPDTEPSVHVHDDDHDCRLPELRAGVGGGFIERVALSSTVAAWVDESGLLKGLPRNARLEFLAGRSPLVGDAYLTGVKDPDTPGMSRSDAGSIAAALMIDLPES